MRINITVPVLNEENKLEASIRRVVRFVEEHLTTHRVEIVIADNGSSDHTPVIGRELSRRYHSVTYLRIGERGRGRALSQVWLASDADIMSYMDVDLSSDLADFPRLIQPLVYGRADIAIGSRLLPESTVTRCFRREIISRAYSTILRAAFRTAIRDAQCGFKAATAAAVSHLVPQVEDRSWFWDTELLLLAEKQGFRVEELPIRWVESRDSRVAIVQTARDNLHGLYRLRKAFRRGQFSGVITSLSAGRPKPPLAGL
jgi:glycosyltransferase involved in cell wall biosynthesis